MSPALCTILWLALGGNQQATATGTRSDGITRPVTVTWVATGGTISSAGLYTTGEAAGSYPVIATQPARTLAETSAIAITASSPPPAPGVAISPGQSIQAAVDANPAGTTFLLETGTHVRQSVMPKSRDTFRCQSEAVMDGQNATMYAFRSVGGNPDSVKVVGCEIRNYNPPAQQAAIEAGSGNKDETTGWIVDSVNVHDNANIGIRLGHEMKLRRSNIHHNGRLGVGGSGDDILLDGNTIAYNNPTVADLGFESGGTKFVLTNRLIVRNNFVHHNQGPGLWADIGNRAFLFEQNRSEDNLQEGIVIEISYNGVIRNNTVRRNGLGDSRRRAWLWGAGIGIHASGGTGIEVYGNTLEGNAHGIALLQQHRGTNHVGEPPPSMIGAEMYVQNVNVHDNTIKCGAGTLTVAGAAQDVGSTAIFTSRNNRFVNNTYMLTGCGGSPFAWMNGYRTQTEWKSYAQDVTSKFVR